MLDDKRRVNWVGCDEGEDEGKDTEHIALSPQGLKTLYSRLRGAASSLQVNCYLKCPP